MNTPVRIAAALPFFCLLLGARGCGPVAETDAGPPPVGDAGLPGADGGADAAIEPTEPSALDGYEVLSVTHLEGDAGRVDWSPDGRTIYFDRAGADGLFDVWQMRTDGSEQECLTCEHADLPAGRHMGQPAAHPHGEWLAFQGERTEHHDDDVHSPPGHGVFNDIWVMHLPSRRAFRLTEVGDGRWGRPRSGSLHPVFSHDGEQLLWTDMVTGWGSIFGTWQLALARFVVEDGVPRLEERRNFAPGDGQTWFESHGFGPDDSWIYFSGNLLDQFELFADIGRMNLSEAPAYERLTFSAGPEFGEEGHYEEHAHFSPDFDVFAHLSDEGGRAELWLASADGSERRRVTGFNIEGSDEFAATGGLWSVPSDNAWNPSPPPGRAQIALYVQVDFNILINSSERNEIWIVEFARP